METPMVTVHDLRAGYGRARVLRDLSLTIEHGEIVSLVGPNGSGKSTLLKTIAGLLPVRRGETTLWGNPRAHLSPREVARKLAFVSQGVPPPTGLTVEDVVSQGRFPHRSSFVLLFTQRHQEAVENALQETALVSLRHRLMTTLSGRECQRVWLAMALAQEPSLLVLDEPTTYLDIAHQLDMLELVVRLNRDIGLTVFMALHDFNLAARFSHRVIVLAEGRIAAQGPPAEVLTPTLLSHVFGVAVTRVQVPGMPTPILYPLQTKKKPNYDRRHESHSRCAKLQGGV
jgi:iron complex transport system ATP-binding protein